MTLAVRRLGPGDVAAARRLNALFAAAFEDESSYAHCPPPDDWLEQLLADPGIFAIVCEAGDAVLGGLVAYTLRKFEQARTEIYLYDLAVAERARRQGIATALIAELQTLAFRIEAWVIFVQADHADAPAIALYEGLGQREDVLHFDIPPRPRRAG